MDLSLPLDYAAIERILPHRYPFLLVDRITELEVDKRIVGIKNVSLNERYLLHISDLRCRPQTPERSPEKLTPAAVDINVDETRRTNHVSRRPCRFNDAF